MPCRAWHCQARQSKEGRNIKRGERRQMSEAKVVEIPATEIEVLIVRVRGTSPLLTHRFIELSGAKAPKTLSPEKQFQDGLYPCGEGYGLPTVAFKKSIVRAFKDIQGHDMTTAKQRFFVQTAPQGDVGAGMTLIETWDEGEGCYVPHGVPVPFTTSAVNRKTHDRVITTRPMFRDWSAEFLCEHDMRAIPQEIMLAAIQSSGWGTGVGSWRPECDGEYGRYEIASVQVIQR